MRITGYRALTTRQEWGRSVGDSNGVFPTGVLDIALLLVDTDEGITGVGMGSHVELAKVFAAAPASSCRFVSGNGDSDEPERVH